MHVLDIITLVVALVLCGLMGYWLSVRRRVDKESAHTHDPDQREAMLKFSGDVDRGKAAGQGFLL